MVFAAMICAASVPLGRYVLRPAAPKSPPAPSAATPAAAAETSPGAPATKQAPVARDPGAGSTAAFPTAPDAHGEDRLAEIMAELPEDPAQASTYLVDHAVRARDSKQMTLAEMLLGRATELDDRNPNPAFALAQLRFEQGNYEGAEGWLANAIRLRPQRAEYHALYAQILTRLGRESEARDEQRQAQRLGR